MFVKSCVSSDKLEGSTVVYPVADKHFVECFNGVNMNKQEPKQTKNIPVSLRESVAGCRSLVLIVNSTCSWKFPGNLIE